MNRNRIEILRRKILEHHLEGFLIANPIDLYYFTGFDLSSGFLIITLNDEFLVVDGRYFENVSKNTSKAYLLDETSLAQFFPSKVGLDSETINLFEYDQLKNKFSHIEFFPMQGIIKQLRMIKDDEEIQALKNAATLGSLGCDYAIALLKEGISEKEIALEMEWFWRKSGASGVSFSPIIAFGKNSSMPHYRAGNAKLEPNQIVLLDIGVTLNHYHSDMTRVVFFGEVDKEIEKIFSIVEEAYHKAVKLIKPGITVGEIDEAARSYIASQGYGEKFPHSLGHGIGLEVHEAPLIRNRPAIAKIPLQKGMVITIEPGIYLPNIGGIRLEDTLLITENSYENLTNRPFFIKK